MSSKERITILIPTLNRSDFLSRLLHYFADTEYHGWIFIGDSSNDWHIAGMRQTIESLKGRLNVRHFECPGLSAAEAMEHMNQFIATPYCVFCADDDFLCVRGLDRCIDFLESNPDYGAAHGIGIAAVNDRSGPYGNISRVEYYQHVSLNTDSGSQRLRDYFTAGSYTLLHDVHRTPDWIDLNQGFLSMPWARQGFIFDGLTPPTISAIRNKVKELDCLYLMRFGHDSIYSQVHVYDWFTNQDWFPGFKDLHDRAIAELIRQENIGKEAAEAVFKQAFSSYLGRLFSGLLPPVPQSYRQGILSRLKRIAVRIPGLQAAYKRIMPRFRAPDKANLLPSLLRLTSPYHQDFMPIYRAITTPAVEENTGKKNLDRGK